MTGWEKDQGTGGSMLKLWGDPTSAFTKELGLVLDHPGPMSVLGNPRCKRFSMLIDDGVIKSLNVAEGPDDPAGDNAPQVSMVDKMLEDLKGGAAALQYPTSQGEAAASPKGVASAMRGQSLNSLWHNSLPKASHGFSPSQSQHLTALRGMPHQVMARPPQVFQHAMGRRVPFEALSAQDSPDIISIAAVALMCFCMGSGVTYAVFRLRRVPQTAAREPFLA